MTEMESHVAATLNGQPQAYVFSIACTPSANH